MHSTPHLFACIGATTSRIDAENDGFHVFVIGQLVEIFDHPATDDFIASAHQRTTAGYINNIAGRVVNGHLIIIVARVFSLCGDNFRTHKRHFLVVHALTQLLSHLIRVCQVVNQLQTLVVCAIGQRDVAICIGIEGIGAQFSRGGHRCAGLLPQVRDHTLHLFAVGRTHFFENERFDGTFVGSDFENLRLHAHFLHEPRPEHRLHGDAVPI